MARINQNFDLFAGDDRVVSYKVEDEAGEEITLDNSTAIWVLVRSSGIFRPVITKTTENSGIEIHENRFRIILNHNDTILLEGKYNYELRMEDPNGKQSVVATGDVFVHKSITLMGQTQD